MTDFTQQGFEIGLAMDCRMAQIYSLQEMAENLAASRRRFMDADFCQRNGRSVTGAGFTMGRGWGFRFGLINQCKTY